MFCRETVDFSLQNIIFWLSDYPGKSLYNCRHLTFIKWLLGVLKCGELTIGLQTNKKHSSETECSLFLQCIF